MFSITLFLGLREVLQDLFLESALVYFLSNTKVLKTLFIQLSKIHKLEIKDTVLHRIFDGTGELNKGSSLIFLLLILGFTGFLKLPCLLGPMAISELSQAGQVVFCFNGN